MGPFTLLLGTRMAAFHSMMPRRGNYCTIPRYTNRICKVRTFYRVLIFQVLIIAVTDLQWAPDRTYFITASKDKSAKICATDSLEVLKPYTADTPLNSAAITPVKDYVILG